MAEITKTKMNSFQVFKKCIMKSIYYLHSTTANWSNKEPRSPSWFWRENKFSLWCLDPDVPVGGNQFARKVDHLADEKVLLFIKEKRRIIKRERM